MNSKHKVIIVGCGSISRAKLEATKHRTDMEYVALVDLNLESAQKLASEYNLTSCLTTDCLEEAIKTTGADVVFDCTVPAAHKDVTLTALKKGCSVLGEKPLADSMPAARTMVEAAATAGKLYSVVQNRRFVKGIITLKAFIDSGAIGEVTTLKSDFFIAPHFGGFRDEMGHVLLLDMSIHHFDAARYLSNQDPVSVYANDWNPKASWYAHGAATSALFTMTNEVRFIYNGSWCSEGLPTGWESEWRIIGTKGSVIWDGAESIKAQVVAKAGGFMSELEDIDVPILDIPNENLNQAGVIDDFFKALESGTATSTVCSENIKSLQMVFSAIESSEKNEVIHF